MTDQLPSEIPDRLFFRIGDVSELTGVQSYVLRFWESEFPMLAPKKTSGGQRQYRRKDVETVLEIKRLLYDEGFTIPGARKALRGKSKARKKTEQRKEQPALPFPMVSPELSAELAAMKEELRDIVALLSAR